MRRSRLVGAALGLAIAAGAWWAPPARAEQEVDLALVIAVDVSFSMDPDEQALQREGFIQAFRSPTVHDAIRRGMLGRIGVTYMEWAGAGDQRVVLPWMIIDGPESAAAFSAELAGKATRRASRTSISGAIDFSAKLLAESGLQATRQVIDVSGDGPNNQGRPVLAARREALDRGIVINGLPIMLKEPGYFDIPDLDLYYRDCVVGGAGSFMVPVKLRDQFVEAVKTKIILEVASTLAPEAPAVVPAAAGGERANCLAGEAQWRDRMGN